MKGTVILPSTLMTQGCEHQKMPLSAGRESGLRLASVPSDGRLRIGVVFRTDF